MAQIPTQMHLIEEKDLQINCIVLMGTPQPKIQWLKNGNIIEETPFLKVNIFNKLNNYLGTIG